MKFFATAWTNIRRSPYQALAAILIITQTFLVVSLFIYIIIGSAVVINYFEQAPQATAFFKNNVTDDQINQLKDQILATGKVSHLDVVSQQEAFQRYKQIAKNDPLLLDLVSANILPQSIEVSTKNINDIFGIADMMQKNPNVDRVVFEKDIVERLVSWTNFLRKFGIALIVILSLDSVFIMLIIISIKISQKKEDIEIMRLIGASKWYIRSPFLLEGVIYGIIGAIIGWAVSVGVLLYAAPLISSVLQGIPLLPVSPTFLLEVFVFEFIMAVLLGIFSSYLAVLRYLK